MIFSHFKMTKRGSYLALLSNADKARFKEEVEDKPSEGKFFHLLRFQLMILLFECNRILQFNSSPTNLESVRRSLT
jgi:hypothetical protein